MKKYTVVAVLTLCLCFGASVVVDAACTGSSPTWTSTPDQASVAACVASAVSGDTINVSAGSAQWSSVVSWTGKNLTIAGAGASQTILTTTSTAYFFINIRSGTSPTGTNPNTSVISGFTFTCGQLAIAGQGWRIHHNVWTCPTLAPTSGIVSHYEYKNTETWGLIDHNTFTNGMVLTETYPGCLTGSNCAETTHYSTPLGLGTRGAVYIEDNTFTWTVFGHATDCNYSGKFVFRFNVVNDTYLETHSVANGGRACRKWEFYGNTLTNENPSVDVYCFYRIRGGTGVVFNNTATGVTSNAGICYDNRRSSETLLPAGKCDGPLGAVDWDTNTLANGWPCRDQIGTGTDDYTWIVGSEYPPPQTVTLSPAYSFLNLYQGLPDVPAVINQSDQHIVANRDFYDYTATFDGTSGVGVGVKSAMPATCTAGVAYWVTDEGYWNAKNTVLGLVQPSGALYKCTSTNFWKPYYVPFSYPHPLQSGLAAPTWP